MDIFHAVILAVVEGLSEFLPISSTGHLILTTELLGLPHSSYIKSFTIFIQLGAIAAVVMLYWKRLLLARPVLIRVVVASVPSVVVGLLLYAFIKEYLLGNGGITAAALFFGGCAFLLIEWRYHEREHHTGRIEDIRLRDSFLIGVGQVLAVIPGVSRAGATIVAALLVGTKRTAAVEFSFLLAIPTILGASLLDLVRTDYAFTGEDIVFIFVGTVVSFALALLAVKTFLQYISHHTFIPFGVYRIVVAVVFWLFVLRG